MNPDERLLTAEERVMLQHTALGRPRLEEQYVDLEQQQETASFGMWVFLATEVMFFGALFLGLGVYRNFYGAAFEKGSDELNWTIGGINTAVLLISSFFMAMAVHATKLQQRRRQLAFLALTALLGMAFLCFKALEYYLDYRENLIPGWRFEPAEWTARGLRPDEVPHVKLFLLFYWIMTLVHGLHVTIGIAVVLVMLLFSWRGHYSAAYYSPVDVTGLYWHFVDIVWIFLLPMLYLQGTHHG